MTSETEITNGVWQAAPLGGTDSIYALDALIIFMCILATWHAHGNHGYGLLFLGFIVGLLTETLSIRLGGTHCHASSPLVPDISDCSSLNSVLY